MPMHLPNDCQFYQELLSTPHDALSRQQRHALENHLQHCSACVRFQKESGTLHSLLHMLPVPDIEPGLPPQLEELLNRSKNERYQQRLQELRHRADVAKKNGDDSLHNNQLASALDHYVQALGFYGLLESHQDETIVLEKIANIQHSLQNMDAAISMGKEVALYRKAGEAILSHMKGMDSRSHQSRSAVLDQPVHNETIVRIPEEATRATPPLPDDPQKPEMISLTPHTDTVFVKRRTQRRWIPPILLILVILIVASGTIWQIASLLQATPTPPVSSLNIELTISTNSNRLLAGDSTTVTNIEQQISTQLQRQNISQLTANIVKTSGGGTDLSHDQQVAHQINSILRKMNGPNIVFNSQTVFEDHIDLNKPDGTITIEIYAFAAPTDLITAGTLTVGSDTTYPPQEFIDTTTGRATGFDIDLITAMAHRMGLNVEVKNANFSTITADLNAKHYDLVISAQATTDTRKKEVDFVPYFNSGMSLLVQKGNPQHIQSLKDLCGQTVGVEDGTTELDKLNATDKICKAAGKSNIKMTVLANQTDVIQLLMHHLVTAIFQDSPVTDYYNKTYPGQFEVVGSPINVGPEGISIRKGDTSMFNAVQQAFNAVKADGTYDKLFEKWQLNSAQKI